MVPSAVLAEMQTALTSVYPSLQFAEGEQNLARHVAPPAITWVDQPSTFDVPEQRSTNPRALYTDVAVLEAHIWASDRDQARAMLHDVVRAAWKVAYGSLDLQGYEPRQPQITSHGMLVVLTLAFRSPVTDRAFTTVVPTAFTTTPGVAGDGKLEPGES